MDEDKHIADILTYTITKDGYGNIFYRNHLGQLHRVDGPAIITVEGNTYWYLNGTRHREGGPAVEWSGDRRMWFLDGKQYGSIEYETQMRSRNGQ